MLIYNKKLNLSEIFLLLPSPLGEKHGLEIVAKGDGNDWEVGAQGEDWEESQENMKRE